MDLLVLFSIINIPVGIASAIFILYLMKKNFRLEDENIDLKADVQYLEYIVETGKDPY
jgi:hypothetical protein